MRVIIAAIITSIFMNVSSASAYFQNPELAAKVEALYQGNLDPLDAKLTVDALLDPAQDPQRLHEIIGEMGDVLVATTKDMKTNDEKLQALRTLIYQSSDGNGYRPFAYDLVDPLGKKPENRLLGNYIKTRVGNCITMPLLFLILGKRIGLPIALANAPLHYLIKYTDDRGVVRNVETTSGGGFARDEWVRKQLPMSDAAIANGIYLRSLTPTETIGEIATIVLDNYYSTGKCSDAVVVANVILNHDPRNVHAILARGSAFGCILQRDVLDKYKSESEMPSRIRTLGYQLMHANQRDFAFAKSLGWRETDGKIPDGKAEGTQP